jgi:hypothetical protein
MRDHGNWITSDTDPRRWASEGSKTISSEEELERQAHLDGIRYGSTLTRYNETKGALGDLPFETLYRIANEASSLGEGNMDYIKKEFNLTDEQIERLGQAIKTSRISWLGKK